MVSLEKILEPTNLTEALKQVVGNKGAPGVDGMAVDELEPFIRSHPGVLSQTIRDGWGLHESGAPNKVRNRQVPNGMPVTAV